MDIHLRPIEIKDITLLYEIENDRSLWKYSNRSQPYSKALLLDYISNAHQDIFQARQLRFAIANSMDVAVGFIDLFEFEPLHHRAGVGIVIQKNQRGKGYAKKALEMLEIYVRSHLELHQLYAGIAIENHGSIALFEGCGFEQTGVKKSWNFYNKSYHDELFYQKIL